MKSFLSLVVLVLLVIAFSFYIRIINDSNSRDMEIQQQESLKLKKENQEAEQEISKLKAELQQAEQIGFYNGVQQTEQKYQPIIDSLKERNAKVSFKIRNEFNAILSDTTYKLSIEIKNLKAQLSKTNNFNKGHFLSSLKKIDSQFYKVLELVGFLVFLLFLIKKIVIARIPSMKWKS